MKNRIRNFMALGASLSLVALTGCSGLMGGNVEDAPALSDIDDLMWTSMEEAGSVTISTEAGSGQGPEAEMFRQMSDGELTEIRTYGALDGTASAMSLGDDELFLSFGDNTTYLSADAILNMISEQSMSYGAEDQQVVEDLKGQFAGLWIDYSSQAQSSGGIGTFDVSVRFNEIRDGWATGNGAEGTPVDRGEISAEGTHEVRDEVDVWVYGGENEGDEFVLEANHESPRLVSVTADGTSVHFSDWGETELPEEPDQSQMMTEQEHQQLLNSPGGTGAAPDDNGSSGQGLEPNTSGTGSGAEPNSNPSSEFEPDGSYSGSDIVSIPDVGTFNCEGPKPGDPGFTDPNGNYTDAEIQKIQDACNS